MPAKSGAQQKAAGAALAAKRGELKASSLKGASRSMYESMSENELDEMASTRRKGKPEHMSSRGKKNKTTGRGKKNKTRLGVVVDGGV